MIYIRGSRFKMLVENLIDKKLKRGMNIKLGDSALHNKICVMIYEFKI